MKKQRERSRADIIIDEIKSGGFTEDELDAIMNACVEAQSDLPQG